LIIPQNAIIAVEKVRDYLLKQRVKDDKAKYLAQAGYARAEYSRLVHDIRNQLLPGEGILQEPTRFGEKYILHGVLKGPNGIMLPVRTIWERHNVMGWKFITLLPDKENRQ
jgi:uncharacterized protein DUF6883